MRYSFFSSIRTHLLLLVLISVLPALGIVVYERLDGSGYPQELKDGQILLETQIIAVADKGFWFE